MKVLRVLCPNLTDDSKDKTLRTRMKIRSRIHHSSQGLLPLPPPILIYKFGGSERDVPERKEWWHLHSQHSVRKKEIVLGVEVGPWRSNNLGF